MKDMIKLTKLDKSTILLNLESIKYIESTPDTLIFFVNGESLMVREGMDEIVARVLDYKASVLQRAEHSAHAD